MSITAETVALAMAAATVIAIAWLVSDCTARTAEARSHAFAACVEAGQPASECGSQARRLGP